MVSLIVYLVGVVHVISNQCIEVGVTDCLSQFRPGSIVYLTDKYSGSEIAGEGQFSGINSGSFIPENGTIQQLSDTSLVFQSTQMTDGTSFLPIMTTIEYTVVDRGLEISYRFEFLEECEVWNPLDIDYCLSSWSSVVVSNQTAVDEQFQLSGTLGFQRFSGDQLFRLSGDAPDALFLLPNVSKAMVVIDDYSPAAYMSIRVIDTEEPRENALGPVLHSTVPAGAVYEHYVRFSMDELFSPVFISAHLEGGERSAAWMLDELSFVHPWQGYMWAFSETADGDEAVSAGLIQLLETHPEMKMNWLLLPDGILTDNRDSVWFEPGHEDSWSHWHCTWRFSTEAPQEYLQWLRNIQDNVYPWAERVQMGSHGYHHTPNPDSSYGEFHEFITYEPWEHQERFTVNFQDLAACGLDTSLVRVIRYPGHRTSLSGLEATIDHGFTFFCNGWRLIDWYAGKQFRNQWISRFETSNGRMWGSNSVWWGDYQMMYPCEYLSEVMEKGKFGLLGCHPIAMLAAVGGSMNPEAYARIDSVMSSLENDYANFIWLFPSEYGDFLEACFNVSVSSIRDVAPELEMRFTGEVPEGLTFCACLDPGEEVLSATLDGASIPWEVRDGGRLFAVAPSRPAGDHVFRVTMDPAGIQGGSQERSGFGVFAESPSSCGGINIFLQGGYGSEGGVTVLDLAGRVVLQGNLELDDAICLCPGESLSPGVYFIIVSSEGITGRTRTVVIR